MATKSITIAFYAAGILVLAAACRPAPRPDRLPYYCTADFTPQWSEAGNAVTHRIPGFIFLDQTGQQVTEKNMDGHITVVDFFFTACPGICKKLTNHMAQVQQAFRDDPAVLLLSHSVTPERDSVPVLATYATENGVLPDKWRLLTGPRSAIYTIARQSYFADEDMGMQQDSATFLHTENILLIDKQRHIRGVYKGTVQLEIDNLVADIKKLEQEE